MSDALEGKTVFYEDEVVAIVLPEKPAAKGHLQVMTKKKYSSLSKVPDKDVEHLFYTASFTATALFEGLGAQGTNIIAGSGNIYKEDTGHVLIDVVARNENDGINFLWQPKKMDDAAMKKTQGKLKDKADFIGVKKEEKKPEETKVVKIEAETEEKEDGEKEESYLVKQLKRIP